MQKHHAPAQVASSSRQTDAGVPVAAHGRSGYSHRRESALRLITMILVEQSEDWMTEQRYMSPESLELVLQS